MVKLKRCKITTLMLSFILMFLCFLPANILSASAPQRLPDNNYYIDELGMLDETTKDYINETNKSLTNQLGSEILFVTSGALTDQTPFDYSVELFNKYQPGAKDKQNGMLFLLVIDDNSEKEYNLEVRVGYGIEGILNDGKVGRVLDNEVIPSFKNGDYNKGIRDGLDVFSKELISNKEEIATNIEYTNQNNESLLYRLIRAIVILVILYWLSRQGMLPYLLLHTSSSGGSYRGGGSSGRGSGGGRTGGGGASR